MRVRGQASLRGASERGLAPPVWLARAVHDREHVRQNIGGKNAPGLQRFPSPSVPWGGFFSRGANSSIAVPAAAHPAATTAALAAFFATSLSFDGVTGLDRLAVFGVRLDFALRDLAVAAARFADDFAVRFGARFTLRLARFMLPLE